MSDIIYAPILKWKTGERKALENLPKNSKQLIRPIIEIVDEEDKQSLLGHLNSCFQYPFYVDTSYIDEGDRSYLIPLIEFINQTREVYPVISDEEIADLPLDLTKISKRILFKIPIPENLFGPTIIETIQRIKNLSTHNIEIDLMLNLETVKNEREASVIYAALKDALSNHLLKENFYKKIFIGVTSFPPDLSDIQAGGEKRTNRLDFQIFQKTLKDFKNSKPTLIYSDFGVTKFTDTDLDYSRLRYGILPKARYTTNQFYWILKGEKDHKTGQWLKSYTDIAKEILSSNYYFGENFSAGDLEIKKRALEELGPGNNTNWVTIGVNHHVSVLIEQLSTLYGI